MTGIVTHEPFRVIGTTHALCNELRQIEVPTGATVAEALEAALIGSQVEWPFDHFVASVGDVRIPREHWHHARPKPGTVVVFRPVPGNFGDDSLRSLLIVGLAIAALFVAPMIAGALGLAGVAGATALIGGAITLGGALLVNALIPVRTPQIDKTGGVGASLPMIAGAQNEARQWDAVPVVLGRHRLSPMYASNPYTFFSGQKQFLNLLFCAGYGPLQLSSLKIGETPIGNFEEVTTEIREGRASDAAITLLPRMANEQQVNVGLRSVDSWVTRTTTTGTSQISIDLVAQSGIYSYNTTTGAYDDRPVTINVEYRLAGTAGWTSRPNIVFTRTRDTVRKGDVWSVASGTYDVRVRKLTTDYSGTGQVAEAIVWLTLRAFEYGNPVTFSKPLAQIAIRVRATDQLNGVINTFNCIAESYVKSFNGTTWVNNQLSRNPADLFRHVLQGPANARARSDAQIDLDSLEDWWADCRANDFSYNAVISDRRTVREVLADIAAVGRATVALRNGKWGVSFPRATDTVSWHFTPRNSSGLSTSRVYREMPHALRVRFINSAMGYLQDEVIVFNDNPATPGLPYTPATATLYESIEFPGITKVQNIHKAARYQLAQAVLRPETHTLTADVESLRLERGDKVMLSSDTLLIGTGYGRVVSVDAGAQLIVVDNRIIMNLGKSYQIKFTMLDGTYLTRSVFNTSDDTDVIRFDAVTDGLSTMPDVGSLFSFGETARVTNDYRILDVRPGADFSAQLMLVDDAPNIDDTGPIPAYDPLITIPPDPYSLTPLSLTFDERFSGSGITAKAAVQLTIQIPRVGTIRSFEFQAMDVDTSNEWVPFAVIAAPYLMAERLDLEAGNWNFRVRALFAADHLGATNDNDSSAWIYSGVVSVLGLNTPPPDVQNFSISVSGDTMHFQWDPVGSSNLAFYRVKYSPIIDGSATWGSSIQLFTASTNRGDAATSTGTFSIKAVTFAGIESVNENAVISTNEAINVPNIVEVISEAPHIPNFPGIHNSTQVQGLLLTLAFSGGSYTLNRGFYRFGQSIDLGAIYTSRITSFVKAYGLSVGDTMSNWPVLSDVPALDNADPSSWKVELGYIKSNGPEPKSIKQIITNQGLLGNLKLLLEAGPVESWPGSGQKWLDESGGHYDFFRGADGVADATDPTYVGTPGGLLRTNYWSFDGGDYFTYDSTNETWMDAVHKNNAQFSILVNVYVPSLDTGVGHFLMGTTYADMEVGFQVYIYSNQIYFLITNGITIGYHQTFGGLPPLTVGWHSVGFSMDEAAGTFVYMIDGATGSLVGQAYTSPSAAASTRKFNIGAAGGGGGILQNGWRIHSVAMWQGVALSAAQMASLGTLMQSNDNFIWGGWLPFAVTDVTARAIQFGIWLDGSPDGLVSPAVSELGVTIDMPDRHIGFLDQDSGISGAGYTINFVPAFKVLRDITILCESLNTTAGERYVLLSKDESHVTIIFYNSSSTVVSRRFSLHAYGYGRVAS